MYFNHLHDHNNFVVGAWIAEVVRAALFIKLTSCFSEKCNNSHVQNRVSADFNAPNKDQVFEFLDTAIMKHGVNLIDTAEQYPIPSDGKIAKEGDCELVIGEWMKVRGMDKGEGRKEVVIASKITGGR